MAFTIIYWPLNKISGVGKSTATKETAAEAWGLVQQLHASDEQTEIKDASGRSISGQELRLLAEREAN